MLDEIIAPLLSTEWGRRTGLAAIIVFSLLLLYVLIETPFVWHSDYRTAHPITTAQIAAPASDQTLALIKQLPDQHLFGASNIKNANYPITSLQLHLIGIMEANTESASRVIISAAGQPGKTYKVGDNLSSDVRIKTITSDGVILENDGHMEKLPLPRPPLTFEGMPKNILSGE